jgi:sigma-E factor negative regulatory protein RseB
MMFARIASGLLLAIAAPLHAQPAQEPAALIERMVQALQGLEYEGTFVYVHEGRVDSVHVTRTLGPDGPMERLVTLSGDRREVLREAGELRCLTRGGTVVASAGVQAPSFPGGLANMAQWREHYRMSIAGSDRVAGYEATVVDAAPLDSLRYGYRLWLDRATGMLLASMVREASGAPVEQLAFTQLHLQQAPDGATAAVPAGEPARPPATPSRWYAAAMPAGFSLVSRVQAEGDSEHLLYSDGLASVSIYIEPSGRGLLGATRRGAVNAFGRAADDAHVVVVGDLPAATVASIAGSVARTK